MNPLDLTPEQISPAFPGAPIANIAKYWPYVRNALQEAQLDSGMIVAYALGTVAAETAGFAPISEGKSRYNTKYKLFDRYDNRSSLGNGPGDGARYKGRGFVQLTGRANYRRYGERAGIDLESDPGKANEPDIAAQHLAMFIADREADILTALKAQNLAKARRLVNGGTHGLERFTNAYRAILRALA